jgi:hypothetical protein
MDDAMDVLTQVCRAKFGSHPGNLSGDAVEAANYLREGRLRQRHG